MKTQRVDTLPQVLRWDWIELFGWNVEVREKIIKWSSAHTKRCTKMRFGDVGTVEVFCRAQYVQDSECERV